MPYAFPKLYKVEIRWNENTSSSLSNIQIRFKRHLLLDDFDTDIIETEATMFLYEMLRIKCFYSKDISIINESYIDLIIDLLVKISNKKIYLDGGKYLEELRNIIK